MFRFDHPFAIVAAGRVLLCAVLWIPAGWTATMLVKLGSEIRDGFLVVGVFFFGKNTGISQHGYCNLDWLINIEV